ncbi:MAG: molybdenum ABC transporter ATP-binding protein [Gammaproteobacteria bacterium TMED78]|nr:MAG: molybdenum ABC transporter ATP-binding protein [Gammaproteobacteria bacterium TMED78]|tara:strand:+ start:83 stop:1147 length:1065 start_codon:yes stop_codon:yes gene_type:complete
MIKMVLDINLQLGNFSLLVNEEIQLSKINLILGPNGAGKTSLLRCISGLEIKSKGLIKVDNTIWQDSPLFIKPHLRDVGYVFQDSRLFNNMSVKDNLLFAKKRALNNHSFDLDEIIRILELESLLDRHPLTLSSGEKQRVAIARATIRKPVVMLMDEPLSSIDIKRRKDIIPYIERIPSEYGIPIIYVTHNIEEVTRLADKVITMSSGKITSINKISGPGISLSNENNESSTLIEGKIISHNEDISKIDLSGQFISIPKLNLDNGKKIRLNINSKDVAISTIFPKGLSIRNVLKAEIESINNLEEFLVEINLKINKKYIKAKITKKSYEDLSLKKGQEVYALIKSVSVEGMSLI